MIQKMLFFSVLFFVSTSYSQELELKIEWRFKHLITGFSYTNKLKVEIDGIEQHETGNFSQSETGIVRFTVSNGMHRIRITDYIFYAGKWEEHSKQNDYALDALFDSVVSFKSNLELKLTFDIRKGRIKASWKPFRKNTNFKSETHELNAIWNFYGVKEGFNLPCRMRAYIDHELVFTSEVFLQTQPGNLMFSVVQGKHHMRFMIECFYNHQWEEVLKKNDYSIDAFYESKKKTKEPKELYLTFNINTETTSFVWK